MAHISAGLEYGLHCLLFLVDPRRDLPPASARDLAGLQGVSVEYVAKLFTKLQKAGRVIATEGFAASGSHVRLARSAFWTWSPPSMGRSRCSTAARSAAGARSEQAPMGNARRLLDTRHHAGGGDAHARGAGLAQPRRPRRARGRKGAAQTSARPWPSG